MENFIFCAAFEMKYNLNNTFRFQGLQLTNAIQKSWQNIVENNVSTVHKKQNFPLRISLVNMTKPAEKKL